MEAHIFFDNLLQHPCKYKEHSLKGFPPIFVTINHLLVLKPNKTYFRKSLTRKLFHKPLKNINLFMILVTCHLKSYLKALEMLKNPLIFVIFILSYL